MLLTAVAAIRRCARRLPPPSSPTPKSAFKKGDYESALAGYRQVIARFLSDWRARQARFTEGFILQKKLKKLAQAREAFQQIAAHDAADGLATHALYHIASVDEQSGDADKAIQSFTDFVARTKGHLREKNAAPPA